MRILFGGRSLPSPPPGGGGVVVTGGGVVDIGGCVVVGGTVVAGGTVVVVTPGGTVVVGPTLPPVSSRPGGIEKGSRDPARDTGGSVSRGVGDGVALGDSPGRPVVPVGVPVGPLGSATSSPPSGRSTKKYTSRSTGIATPAICRIRLSRGVRCT